MFPAISQARHSRRAQTALGRDVPEDRAPIRRLTRTVGAPAGYLRPEKVRAEQEDHGACGESRADWGNMIVALLGDPIVQSWRRCSALST